MLTEEPMLMSLAHFHNCFSLVPLVLSSGGSSITSYWLVFASNFLNRIANVDGFIVSFYLPVPGAAADLFIKTSSLHQVEPANLLIIQVCYVMLTSGLFQNNKLAASCWRNGFFHFNKFTAIGWRSRLVHYNTFAASCWRSGLVHFNKYDASCWRSGLVHFNKFDASCWRSGLVHFNKFAASCWRSVLVYNFQLVCKLISAGLF